MGKIAKKSSLQECIFDKSAELTKMLFFRLFFGDFAHLFELKVPHLSNTRKPPPYKSKIN